MKLYIGKFVDCAFSMDQSDLNFSYRVGEVARDMRAAAWFIRVGLLVNGLMIFHSAYRAIGGDDLLISRSELLLVIVAFSILFIVLLALQVHRKILWSSSWNVKIDPHSMKVSAKNFNNAIIENINNCSFLRVRISGNSIGSVRTGTELLLMTIQDSSEVIPLYRSTTEDDFEDVCDALLQAIPSLKILRAVSKEKIGCWGTFSTEWAEA